MAKLIRFCKKHREAIGAGIISGIISGLIVTFIFTPFIKQIIKEMVVHVKCSEYYGYNLISDNNLVDSKNCMGCPVVGIRGEGHNTLIGGE